MSKKDLTPEDILAWTDQMMGVSATETGQKQGCHENTALIRRKRVADFVADKFDINEYRMPLYAAYPLAVKSLLHNLKKHDVATTLGYLRGMQLFVDKNQTDQGMRGLSDDELNAVINNALGVKPDSKG